MKTIIFMILFVSFSIFADERNLNKSHNTNNILSGIPSYVLQNGELKVLVHRYDNDDSLKITQTGELWGVERMLRELNDKRKQVADEVCKRKFKPDSVTITVLFVSATWDIEKLCKN